MLPSDVLERIRYIELRTRRLVNDSFAGAYHAVFKGKGIAFESVRPYQPGDDVRDIDWNVTARSGQAYVKKYTEERELTVMIALDTSASALFGTVNRRKRDLAAELGAVLALSAISNNDKVGLMIFSDQIELMIPPRKGRNHLLHLIRDLLEARPANKGTDLSLALQSLNRFLKQKAILFLLSDFLAPSQDYASNLAVLGRKHDLIAVVLSDPLEQRWQNAGLVGLQDAESGASQWVDTSSQAWREAFAERSARFRKMRDDTLDQAQVDRIDIPVDGDYILALTEFFQRRGR